MAKRLDTQVYEILAKEGLWNVVKEGQNIRAGQDGILIRKPDKDGKVLIDRLGTPTADQYASAVGYLMAHGFQTEKHEIRSLGFVSVVYTVNPRLRLEGKEDTTEGLGE